MSTRARFQALLLLTTTLAFTPWLSAQEPEGEAGPPTAPAVVAKASSEGQDAIAGFQRPEGFEVTLFAAEPLVANPVAFCVDYQGRFYVCESFRQNRGVTDNRGHDQTWLDRDLAAQTIEDRRVYHRELLGPKGVAEYTAHDDRIRVVADTDGDGKADDAKVFAEGFNALVDGTGAGVLARGSDVYFTCIPNLYLLQDKDGDGKAEKREVLQHGYGVRVAFRGHDLHGLCMGHDGRLYFSIGDRGYHIEHEGKVFHDPGSGAVFRCELDGSNLEVFATGLRNPQELAFDDAGNLFTGDNNSDSGDKARWVYVMEGGDTGWRMAYQYLNDRGPFNREKIWHPYHPEQPAYVAPPIANFADGPSGLIYYPGVGLPESFKGSFLLCDFRGTPTNSGIRSLKVAPQGAFFEISERGQPFWKILATDLAMGPDGKLYVTDWVNGWNGEGKGRIYAFASAESQSQLAKQTQRLLSEGMSKRPADELLSLLNHADQRVRLEAQFELAARRELKTLSAAVASEQPLRMRRHGGWGLGQLARAGNGGALQQLLVLAEDQDAALRELAARLLGESSTGAAVSKALLKLLQDDEPRVRYFAAISLGKHQVNEAVDPLVKLVADNNGVDPALRHSGIFGLSGAASPEQLYGLANHASSAVRRVAVVALRRQESPLVANYLADPDPLVAVEAARAIHDLPIHSAMPALAAMIDQAGDDDAMVRRVLNANFRVGQPANAISLAKFAADSANATSLRLEAVEMLANWETPSNRDRVLGEWRPLDPRDKAPAANAVKRHLPGLLASDDQSLRKRVIEVAAKLGVEGLGRRLKDVLSSGAADAVKAQALLALGTVADRDAVQLAKAALQSDAVVLRTAGRSVLARMAPKTALPLLTQAVLNGQLRERQQAAADLASLSNAEDAILKLLTKLNRGEIPADTQLDVLEAAQARKEKRIANRVKRILEQRGSESLQRYAMSLEGGDAERGAKIFYERTNVSCVRCHKIDGRGGEVGPNLSGIAVDKNRQYLLESIVEPNKAIAKNFESVLIIDADGRPLSGVLKEETDEYITLMTAEGQLITVLQDDIEARRRGESAMPKDLVKQLSDRDIRDLVEFLANRRTPATAK